MVNQQKLIAKLTPKDFMTGISPAGAHPNTGGVFFKADGLTTSFEAGASQSVNNGLLMAGATGTAIAGNLGTNKVLCSANVIYGGTPYTYFGTHAGHILKLALNSDLSNTFSDVATAGDGLITSMDMLADTDGTAFIFYFQGTHIGKLKVSDDSVSDTYITMTSNQAAHPSHVFSNRILYGNTYAVYAIVGTGTNTFSNTAVLTTKYGYIITDIADDGFYTIVAITNNLGTDPSVMADTRILFWDNTIDSWNREYSIPDPFIIALEKTPVGVFAYGVTGIWQVQFGAEPKKVFSHATGTYTTATTTEPRYGRGACSHYNDALLWGGTSGSNYAVKTFGKLQSDMPTSYQHPFLSTAGKNITYVNGQIVKGYVVVGDDGPNLKAYPFSSSGTPNTGVTVQTVYLPLQEKTSVERIDLIFGEPLASGDSITVAAFTDQDTSASTFGTTTFSGDGAIRRKQTFGSAICEEQLSIQLTYTAGAVKLKGIEVRGTPMTP